MLLERMSVMLFLSQQIDGPSIDRDLHPDGARLGRCNLEQIGECGGPANVADIDVAHRWRKAGALALVWVPAAIGPSPAARIAGRHARLAWAVFCLQLPPPL